MSSGTIILGIYLLVTIAILAITGFVLVQSFNFSFVSFRARAIAISIALLIIIVLSLGLAALLRIF